MTSYLHRLRSVLLIIVLSIVFGCATTTLRETQNHFNQGATIEIRAMDATILSDNPNANPGDSFAALNEYRLAYINATALIKEKSVKLRQDQLLGATYVLKAMSIWRISDLEGDELLQMESAGAIKPAIGVNNSRQELLSVLNEIDQLYKNQNIILGTRDKVLYKALYGFYDHDGGRAAKDYTEAKSWFKSAYNRLEESLNVGVPERHPIRVYVGSAQLRTLSAWNHALYIERKNCNCSMKEDQEEINEKTKETICNMRHFWEIDKEVKKSLLRLLAPIGFPSAFSTCNN